MAINKELYELYKKMKAEGKNITLAELKSQMEEGGNTPNQNTISQTPIYSNTNYEANQNSILQGSLFSSNETTPNTQPSDYSSSSIPNQKSWTTSYSTTSEQSELSTYKGNMKTVKNEYVENNGYMNQFSQTSSYITNVEIQKETYQGNINIQQLKEDKDNTQHSKFGLLGYPLGHSLSEYIHLAGFKSLGLDYTYEILETSPESLIDRIKYLKANNYAGFNVTIPLKIPMTLFLDEVDASADIIGAVNTVTINPDKTMKGYNTDVIGFKNAIPKDFPIAGKTAGILGTGGAARAAITALANSQIKAIKIYTRNVPNCVELLKFLRSKFSNVEFNVFQIEHIRNLSDVNILVNCTPIGMQGRAADLTPVEENELRTLPEGALVYDVIYNPKRTLLLKLAKKNGYQIINGVDMFIHQAVEAEKIWTGKIPDFKDMKIAALENL